jgi:hypothetical protein
MLFIPSVANCAAYLAELKHMNIHAEVPLFRYHSIYDFSFISIYEASVNNVCMRVNVLL